MSHLYSESMCAPRSFLFFFLIKSSCNTAWGLFIQPATPRDPSIWFISRFGQPAK